MLTASILDLRYCRLLTDHLSEQEGERLASEFDYSFAVCYGHCEATNFETVQKNACLIDLSRGFESAFSRFNATSRNEVRRFEKMGHLSFQLGPGEDFKAYFDFYKNCENARAWFPVPEEELRQSLVFTACFENEPISGMSAYAHGKYLRVGRIYSSKKTRMDERLSNLVYGCAAKSLVFELCKYGATHGYETLDLGGVDLQDPSKAGISAFKRSFGGQITAVTIARHANARFRESEHKIRKAGYDIT
ncbi:MAG: hypothetical protein ACKVT2_09420 [Saprospiraceae bacterium]